MAILLGAVSPINTYTPNNFNQKLIFFQASESRKLLFIVEHYTTKMEIISFLGINFIALKL